MTARALKAEAMGAIRTANAKLAVTAAALSAIAGTSTAPMTPAPTTIKAEHKEETRRLIRQGTYALRKAAQKLAGSAGG